MELRSKQIILKAMIAVLMIKILAIGATPTSKIKSAVHAEVIARESSTGFKISGAANGKLLQLL